MNCVMHSSHPWMHVRYAKTVIRIITTKRKRNDKGSPIHDTFMITYEKNIGQRECNFFVLLYSMRNTNRIRIFMNTTKNNIIKKISNVIFNHYSILIVLHGNRSGMNINIFGIIILGGWISEVNK